MPEILEFPDRRKRPVATEAELLDFANKVRKAGGADFLEALLPAFPGVASQCLIARSLNFQCEVGGTPRPFAWARKTLNEITVINANVKYADTDDYAWFMTIHHGRIDQSCVKAEQVASELGLHSLENEILLPNHIGYAAKAFDDEIAFQKYNSDLLTDD